MFITVNIFVIILCIYLPDLYLHCHEFVCIKTFVNKLVYGMRAHLIPGGECHRHKNRFGSETTKKTKLNRTFVTNSYLAWMLVGAQTNLGSSLVHV